MNNAANDVNPKIAPYGTWKSPITAELVTSQLVGLGDVKLDGNEVYWIELRPSEAGRSVIVKWAGGKKSDVIPAPFNARSRVHEYGGGAYLASGGNVYFSNFADNGLYVIAPGGVPELLTPLSASRYADFILDVACDRLICVNEDHSQSTFEPMNRLVSVGLRDGAVVNLVEGTDFYSSPAISPDGKTLAWLCWNHPNMPWDGTELWTANILPDGSIENKQLVAGRADESIFQPLWSPGSVLHFVSDRDGWWNIYRLIGAEIDPLWSTNAEFGEPQWVFGQSTYAFGGPDELICTYTRSGVWYLSSVDTASSKVSEIETPYTVISSLRANEHTCAFLGASPSRLPEIVTLDLAAGKYDVLQKSAEIVIATRYLSIAEPITFTTTDGNDSYANYYAPRNDEYIAPDGELPPLLIACHGGPTSASYSQLSLTVQYWTSRGFAFAHVNYGGSTGYGREFRERLKGNWGIVDVDDCINCALSLVDAGKADEDRLTIHGGSAGGYTALAALTFHEVFAAGASLYGVSDLEALAKDTHKFESRYLDTLIGPYPARADLYAERSPIHSASKLSSPVIFFQGLDDKVVPPNQAEMMVDALKAQTIPVAYVPFEGEGHGFRKADSIKRCLESHLYFYCRVFNIEVADKLPAIEITGLV
jgi:dipeptidyl aminopeptidase/acylaminoacyl peptidase